MAARVSKSITAASVQLKKHLHEYNNIPGVQLLTWKDVTNVSSPLWLFDNFNSTPQHIPKSIKLASITNHHLILRADEEISMLKQEMSCVIKYHQNHLQKLHHLLEESNTATQYGAGVKCLLLFNILEVERNLLKCSNKFSSFITDDSCVVECEKLLSHKMKSYSSSEDGYDNLASSSDVQSNISYSDEDTYDNDDGTNNNEHSMAANYCFDDDDDDNDNYYDPEDEDYDHEDVDCDHNDDACDHEDEDYDHEDEDYDHDNDDYDQDGDYVYDCDDDEHGHDDDNGHYFSTNHNGMNFPPMCSYVINNSLVFSS